MIYASIWNKATEIRPFALLVLLLAKFSDFAVMALTHKVDFTMRKTNTDVSLVIETFTALDAEARRVDNSST